MCTQLNTASIPGHPLCRAGDRPPLNKTEVKCDSSTGSATHLHLTRNCRTRCSNCYNRTEVIFPYYGCLISNSCNCLAISGHSTDNSPFVPILGNGLGPISPDTGNTDKGNSTSFYAPGNGNYNVSSNSVGGGSKNNFNISLVITLNIGVNK